MLNKTYITNILAFSLVLLSLALPLEYKDYILLTGAFALSGSLTNSIAIYMLFNKVPLLYGSGVIEMKFDKFRESIKNLMMSEFFTKEQLDSFFATEEVKIDLEPIIETTDFSIAYSALTGAVMESSFGGMLGMFGGEKALESLEEPFTAKLKSAVITIVKSDSFNETLQNSIKSSSLSDDMLKKVENLIDQRLQELTPLMVKEIIENLIKEHLGWLVIWGGVFGGLIGLVSAVLQGLSV